MASAVASLIASQQDTYSKVSVKAVGSQLVIMSTISICTVTAFCFFRPREKKVYAPKIKYQMAKATDIDDPDYEPPPPPISNGFFAWFSPVIHLKEEEIIANIGLDAAAFLRFLRLLRYIFTISSIFGAALLVIDVIYNLKYVPSTARNALSLFTIENVSGSWEWSALAVSYLINFTVMFLVWKHWRAMCELRYRWFRSPAYQTKIYSRTLMVTQVRKDFRSDDGLLRLMGLLKVDGIKIGPEIDCTSIGRRLGDFPTLVEEHNDAVKDLEKYLVKYLKHDQMAKKRPTIKKGGFLGIGGEKKDAIDYLAKQIKFLRDKIDTRRQAIDSLLRQERKARKGGRAHPQRIEGENYGFVTFKTISEAHRIARSHQGPQKELFGARLQLAPPPGDIIWDNISKEPAEIQSARTIGFVLIGVVCFFNTIPLLVVSLLANLSSLTLYVTFLADWQSAGKWGNWTFSLVSGILPSIISALFGYLLPYLMRKISRFQGAPTRSRLDRAVTARYFFFMIVSNLVVFSLLGVFYNAIAEVVLQIGQHQSASAIFQGFESIPDKIQGTYVQQSTYWLTWLPLRGFLVFFELIQLIKLALVSVRRFMFSHTPRDIREMTKPPYFEYPVVIVNLLFIAAVGMIYAPLAPLVVLGATTVFWFSSIVYKYQLLYVYVSRAESGGRMWNVYVNRLIACVLLMQLLMVLTTGLIRQQWLDSIAAVPPILIMIAFKIYISKTAERQFRYYEPTPQEAEAERAHSLSEKRTRHSDMEKRFLHPALQQDKLFTVMVHKSQEALAREVLSQYPWFAGKHDHDGVEIKAVREENLEYDPIRDGPVDGRSAEDKQQQDWETRSQGSTDMLGGKSELMSTHPSTISYDDPYGENLRIPILPGAQNSGTHLPYDNPSTDQLLPLADRSDSYYPTTSNEVRRPMRQGTLGTHGGNRPYTISREDSTAAAPLLNSQPSWDPSESGDAALGMVNLSSSYGGGDVPYPPSAFTQPPLGYTPPTMRRTATDGVGSNAGSEVYPPQRYETRWDAGEGGDMGQRGYDDEYEYESQYQQHQPYHQYHPNQQQSSGGVYGGYTSVGGGNGAYGQPRDQWTGLERRHQ